MKTAVRWHGWAGFALGLWLALSPWVAGYAGNDSATANAAVTGLALALASHFEASFGAPAIQWLNLAAGVWLLAAPFILAFSGAAMATAICVAAGAGAAALAASALRLEKDLGRLWHSR